jgi:hypothetical protein
LRTGRFAGKRKGFQTMNEDARKNKFDRALGALVGIPDVMHTAPTTIRATSPLIGESQTFIIQTYRQKEISANGEREASGDTVFIEYIDESGAVRIVIPPKVVNVIIRQHDALTARSRQRAAKASAADRKARGIRPAFLKKK